jgi:aryl-alcohol dehydrogenase-like predicted oxidoreductase
VNNAGLIGATINIRGTTAMRYKLLGRSGLRVSEVCLGTMTFGEDWGWGASPEESRKVYDAFLEAGGNFVDTANVYTNGTSERLLGEFMQGQRERIVLATKYTNAAGLPWPHEHLQAARYKSATNRRYKKNALSVYHLGP